MRGNATNRADGLAGKLSSAAKAILANQKQVHAEQRLTSFCGDVCRGFASRDSGAALEFEVAEHRRAADCSTAVTILTILVGVVEVVFVGQLFSCRDVAHAGDEDATLFVLLSLAIRVAAVVEEHCGAESVDD